MKKEVENGPDNEAIRSVKEEIMGDRIKELVEMPRSQPIGYYLKHKINRELIEGLIRNQRYNDSLLATRLVIAEDVLVEIAGYVYLIDFVILDVQEDKKKPFILGTPFLTTAKAKIRQIRNEDLRTELEYFSEDYDEEREMERRPEHNREATPSLRPRSPVVRRQRERVVGFEEAPNREGIMGGRNAEGIRLSEIEAREDENRGVNLPPLLAAHLGRNECGQPLRSSLTSVHGGHQPSTNTRGNLPPNGTLLSHHA
ncbi:hypothetical protein Tco_0482348 [Tanacetum coccineum]